MQTVDLFRCSLCGLVFVADEGDAIPGFCPRFWRGHTIPPEIKVMGRDVRVRVIREYGLETGLLDKQVRRGVQNMDLGICEHGFLCTAICPDCK